MFYAPNLRSRVFAPVWRSHNGAHAAAAPHTGIDRWFDDAFDSLLAAPTQRGLRLQEDDKAYTLSLDAPGLAKEHLNLEIEGAVVRIRSKDDAPLSLRAAYELPLEVDANTSEAKLENGVLTLRLAKLVPASKAVALAIG